VGRIKKAVAARLQAAGAGSSATAAGGKVCVGGATGAQRAVAYVRRGVGSETPKVVYIEEELKEIGIDRVELEREVATAFAASG